MLATRANTSEVETRRAVCLRAEKFFSCDRRINLTTLHRKSDESIAQSRDTRVNLYVRIDVIQRFRTLIVCCWKVTRATKCLILFDDFFSKQINVTLNLENYINFNRFEYENFFETHIFYETYCENLWKKLLRVALITDQESGVFVTFFLSRLCHKHARCQDIRHFKSPDHRSFATRPTVSADLLPT